MLAFAAAALLFVQDPVLTQADYEAFQNCHGQFEGAYATGLVVLADDAEALARLRETGEGLGGIFDEFDRDIRVLVPALDAAAGQRAFQQGRAKWDGAAQRPDASAFFAANVALSEDCMEAGGKVATVLDAAGD
ncbi:MAG TPA: hypothetical protein VGR32_06330 [Brevundimonas sp.]|jgi:hypothetical protein|uniref:hypothetical protein n=1 Tax=Brevundimonas sp. TaxID=1871086 RepID=UPI002DF5469C|nr:hypothetical protein [Brevundimonas sp.]